MDNQQQGNGWVGGSLGTGLGLVGGLSTAVPFYNAVHDSLAQQKKFDDRIDYHYDKKVKAGYGEDAFKFGKPHVKAVNKIADLGDAAIIKARPYAQAAALLYALGLPITAGLLGSTLTD